MPILFVTGMARSGTTWAAQGLAELAGARYIHEPFNRTVYPELEPYFMQYQSADSCDPDFLRILDEKMRPNRRRLKLREYLLGRNLVVKDVHAYFAAECIEAHLGACIVVLTRHPCAVGASWKVRGWIQDFVWRFDVLLGQPALLRFLGEFKTHMRSSSDLFFQFGAYWGAVYFVLRQLTSAHPGWQWVIHEELCDDPAPAFSRILASLKMPVRTNVSDFVTLHDRSPRENEGMYDTYRETRLMPTKWQDTLSTEEIQHILDGAEPFRPDALLTR